MSAAKATLLIEIGCEEIPARMAAQGARDLANVVEKILDKAKLSHGTAHPMWSPRRLVVRVADTQLERSGERKQMVGPPARAAWDADGNPTKAAAGFAKRNGIDVSELEKVETERGPYAAAVIDTPPRTLSSLLAEDFAKDVARMAFPKTMRWGRGEHSFVRPVHWLVALAGKDVLDLELFDVKAGRLTYGHRTRGKGPHEIDSADAYEQTLERACVIVDPEQRRRALEKALAEVSSGRVIEDSKLLDEVANIVEFPGALVGRFDERFVAQLPAEVLEICLKYHQKAFTLGEPQALDAAFAVAVNVPDDPENHVQRGNEWVVSGRLEDALFFWNEDRKSPLADRRKQLDGVLFQRELGSYAAKTARVVGLARAINAQLDGAVDDDELARAGELARCDLVTGLVGEFPELQGVAGGLLARADGEPAGVVDAVYHLYRPAGLSDPVPPATMARLLGLADRLDTLAGTFAVGLAPSGSRDPFALRRAGLAVVLLATHTPRFDLRMALAAAFAQFDGREGGPDLRDKADETIPQLVEFFFERLAYVAERTIGARYDEVAAVRSRIEPSFVPSDLESRLSGMQEFRTSEDFLALAASAKRVRNILAQAAERGEQVEPHAKADKLSLAAETELSQVLESTRARVEQSTQSGDYAQGLAHLASMRAAVDRFFDDVLVMDEDTDVRCARLGLLAGLDRLANSIVDVAELVVEGKQKGARAGQAG